MSFLLTSILFCLFQVQEPKLELDQSLQDYRKAMHYIDVRGDYAQGAEILERIALADDVLAVPGQASWILAQSTRAFTLAGEGERVLPHLAKIRDAALGTAFEIPVRELLLSFAAEGASLDPDFVGYVWNSIGKQTERRDLIRDYGQSLSPYLRYLIETPEVKVDMRMSDRIAAVETLMTVLDSQSVLWLADVLDREPLLRRKVFKGLQEHNARVFLDIQNSGLPSTITELILEFAQNASEGEQDFVLDTIMPTLKWEQYFPQTKKSASVRESLVNHAVFLLESGHRGVGGNALDNLFVFDFEARGHPTPISLRLSSSKNKELFEATRWLFVNQEIDKELTQSWALSGILEEQLRFSLSWNLSAGVFLNPETSQALAPLKDWGLNLLKHGSHSLSIPQYLHPQSPTEDQVKILTEFVNVEHPLVRFLAADALRQSRHQEAAVAFLSNLGDDPTWASHLLQSWERSNYQPVLPSSMEILEPLAAKGPLQEEVRSLLEQLGKDVVTVDMWKAFDLSPSTAIQSAIYSDAQKMKRVGDLSWLVTHTEGAIASNSAIAVARLDPAVYMELIPVLEDQGFRWDFFSAECRAWREGLDKDGDAFIQKHEAIFMQAFRHSIVGSQHALDSERGYSGIFFNSLFRSAPTTAFQIFHDRGEDLQLRKIAINSLDYLRTSELTDKKIAIEYITQMVFDGNEITLKNYPQLFADFIDPRDPNARPFLILYWDKENKPFQELWLGQRFLSTMIRRPGTMNQYRDILTELLTTNSFSGFIATEAYLSGRADELLEELLEGIHAGLDSQNLAQLLTAIGSVNHPRVVEVLMNHLDDPRPEVHSAASSALDHLRNTRLQKQEWAAWASGNGAKSPVAALLNDLKDPEKEIRLAAIASLGTLKSTEALPALVNLLRDPDEDIKQAARKALERINAEPTPPEEIVEEPFEPAEPKK